MSEEKISLKDYADRRFEDNKTAVDAALAAAEKAVNKAEINAEKWRDSANEWRGAMSDRERAFLTRKEFYLIIGTTATVGAFAIAIFKLFSGK